MNRFNVVTSTRDPSRPFRQFRDGRQIKHESFLLSQDTGSLLEDLNLTTDCPNPTYKANRVCRGVSDCVPFDTMGKYPPIQET